MNDKHLDATVKLLKNIPFERLDIPNYQRPYRWTEKNVSQLLNDINKARMDCLSEYRIGSLILHQGENDLNIVDGQQRITTIMLILKLLLNDNMRVDMSEFCSKECYTHVDSINNIKSNYRFIRQWIDEVLTPDEAQNYQSYLLNNCSFVFVEVGKDYLSEAFQMFDSQNGRGKELEAYNLLKAYHMQDMYSTGGTSQEDRIRCDKRWEAATRYNDTDVLKQVIHEHLYRIRLWTRNKTARHFSKNEIDEFKGFSNSKEYVDFPFQNIFLLQRIRIGSDLNSKAKRRLDIPCVDEYLSPFTSIIQPIINGESFFDYVNTYIEMYKILFTNPDYLHSFSCFYTTYCQSYSGAGRIGDQYIRQLYKSLILFLFDKYGKAGVERYYKPLYSIVYRLRLQKKRVYYETVAKYPFDVFSIIANSKSLGDMYELDKMAREPFDTEMFNGCDDIERFIRTNFNCSQN